MWFFMDVPMEEISDEDVQSYHSDDANSDVSDVPSENDGNDVENEVHIPVAVSDQQSDSNLQHQESASQEMRQSNIDQSAAQDKTLSKELNLEKSKEDSRLNSSCRDGSEDDGQICTICFEPWTNSNEHRLVSLRCGHLFGRSCITRWLKGQSARCPQCNARARKSEIRNIYAKAVKVIDSSERDKALQDLAKECELRRKAEIAVAQERLKYTMALHDCERLKRELMEATKLLQEYRSGLKMSENSQSAKSNSSVYSLEKHIDIAKHGGCRIVVVCNMLGMILVSQPSVNELFPGFGFRKISTLDMKPTEFIHVHQKPIKDMAFHVHDGLVLTASLDKTVKITNVISNSVVQSYTLDSDVWSCSWDTEYPFRFYAGLKTGSVCVFDIRFTDRPMHELPRLGSNTPVVALEYLSFGSVVGCRNGGPLVGKLSDCSFYQKLGTMGEYKIAPLPSLGPYTSLSSEPFSGHFLVSCRPSPRLPCVNHTLCEFVSGESGDLICNPVQTMFGGGTQVQLTRSKLLCHPDKESSLLVCAGDEDAQGALIWDGSSGTCIDRLKTDSPVLDLAGLKINHKSFLTSLTDKSLRLYSWNA